jgi:hypothetical protein
MLPDLSSTTHPDTRRIELALFLAGFAAYVSATLLFRWLRAPLFNGVGADGWPAPSSIELAYLIYMTCLPVALWTLLAYGAARRLPAAQGTAVVLVMCLLVLAVVEIDDAWYSISGHHVTWREAWLFVTENWALHYGIRFSDERSFAMRMGKHVLRLLLLFFGARVIARWKRGQRYFGPWFAPGLVAVLVLVFGDILLSAYQVSRGDDQWQTVADANPFRIHPIDRVFVNAFAYAFGDRADLAAANIAFARAVHDVAITRSNDSVEGAASRQQIGAAPELYNVVVVTIEGLNVRLVDSATMPFWTELASRSTSLRDHYSTGNVTEYGVLGLLFGAPPDFYHGTETLPWRRPLPSAKELLRAGSPYIAEFGRHGYHTRLISWELSSWAQVGDYLRDFNEPAFESTDDWKLLPELSRELKSSGRHLVYMHYNGTHFPYQHAARYLHFRPEVPDDFDYTSGSMHEQEAQITNRYRNCLVELDAWLRSLVNLVDTKHTILVFTGDHGEEFFEHSRLGHSSTLEEPQIRTPALLYVPGQAPRVIDAVTSHADFMPTLMDYLGWPQPFPPFGNSLARDARESEAIAAKGNRPDPPVRWAAIAGDSKSVLVEGAGDTLRIVRLLDTTEHPVSFRSNPARWRANLIAAAKLQLHLFRTLR